MPNIAQVFEILTEAVKEMYPSLVQFENDENDRIPEKSD